MSRERQQFIAAYVPDDVSSKLALATAVLDESRSALIRQALSEFFYRLETSPNGSLVVRMAARLSGQWKDQKAAAKATGPSFKEFVHDARERLLKAGVGEETVTEIIRRIHRSAKA